MPGRTIIVRLYRHVLMLEEKGARPVELVPDRDDGFHVKRRTGLGVPFVTDNQGKVKELALSTPGGVSSTKRKP
jgi:hypothetical protein